MSTNCILIEMDRYEELKLCELKLQALDEHGVDNWEGYGDAMETYNEWVNEDE